MPEFISRTERMVNALRMLPAIVPEVLDAQVISVDGLTMAMMLPAGGEHDYTFRFAVTLCTGQRLSAFSGTGEAQEIQIFTSDNHFTLIPLNSEAFVVLLHNRIPAEGGVRHQIADILAEIEPFAWG